MGKRWLLPMVGLRAELLLSSKHKSSRGKLLKQSTQQYTTT